jgi:hypothetical protein
VFIELFAYIKFSHKKCLYKIGPNRQGICSIAYLDVAGRAFLEKNPLNEDWKKNEHELVNEEI